MNLAQAIEKDNIRASVDDRVEDLIDLMESQGYNALPVVKNGQYLGLVHADQLLDLDDPSQALHRFNLQYGQLFLHQEQHIFDALPFFEARGANILPVINTRHGYVGMVTPLGLIHALNEILDSGRPGSILVLEVGQRDNALSHIAHIVESADAQVLTSFARMVPDSTRLEITLKVSATNLTGVVAALLRHEYLVKTTFSQDTHDDGINSRFEHLMNYINM